MKYSVNIEDLKVETLQQAFNALIAHLSSKDPIRVYTDWRTDTVVFEERVE